MTPDTVLRRRAVIDQVEVDGEVLLYDQLHLRLLPGTASQIWARVDGSASAADIAADIAAASRTDSDPVLDSVLTFLSELLDHHVLEVAPDVPTRYVRPHHVGYVRDGDIVLLVDLSD